MRFAVLKHNGLARTAVLHENEAVLLPEEVGDMVALISFGEEGLELARKALAATDSVRVALEGATLMAPIQRFRRDVLCCGWNYWDHFEESLGKREGQDVDRPNAPTFFTKAPDSVIGPRDPIAFDARLSSKWDYEAEVALVIAKTGRSIPASAARSHVFGLTLANDISQRDLQRRHGGQWLKGKSIDGTMPLGPYLITPDELDIPEIKLCPSSGFLGQQAA